MKSPYEVLGISPNATPEEIRLAYREKAKANHPDKVKHLDPIFEEVANQRLKEINAAYELLKNSSVSTSQSKIIVSQTHPHKPKEKAKDQPEESPKEKPKDKPEEKIKEKTKDKLQSFLSFAGFSYGDTMNKAKLVLGNPQSTFEKGDYQMHLYFPCLGSSIGYGLLLMTDRKLIGIADEATKIRGVNILSNEGVERLREIGIYDSKFCHLGRSRNAIIDEFGHPISFSPGP